MFVCNVNILVLKKWIAATIFKHFVKVASWLIEYIKYTKTLSINVANVTKISYCDISKISKAIIEFTLIIVYDISNCLVPI